MKEANNYIEFIPGVTVPISDPDLSAEHKRKYGNEKSEPIKGTTEYYTKNLPLLQKLRFMLRHSFTEPTNQSTASFDKFIK